MKASLRGIGHERVIPSLVARLRATASRWSRKSSIALAVLVDVMWRGWILVQVLTEEKSMRSVGHESQEKWLWEFEAVS